VHDLILPLKSRFENFSSCFFGLFMTKSKSR